MITMGSCFCDAVEFSITGKIPSPWNCYCQNCSKLHGAAFATHTIVRTENFQWIKGFEYVRTIESSDKNYRNFCGKCGSQLAVVNQNNPQTIVIVYAALNSKTLLPPVGELFVSSKNSWSSHECSVTQYEKNLPEEIWQEYASQWSLL